MTRPVATPGRPKRGSPDAEPQAPQAHLQQRAVSASARAPHCRCRYDGGRGVEQPRQMAAVSAHVGMAAPVRARRRSHPVRARCAAPQVGEDHTEEAGRPRSPSRAARAPPPAALAPRQRAARRTIPPAHAPREHLNQHVMGTPSRWRNRAWAEDADDRLAHATIVTTPIAARLGGSAGQRRRIGRRAGRWWPRPGIGRAVH